ncbi:SH3 domain-containing protein [Alkalihalobacillus sp. LMS39]|uniref:SH3 domain-containing protein n=1 Tax=Alkalihalobacillus sp. LMS39 TaxID=2924032 RepID=UPI001FB2AD8D|nr:SH3 domain-containing protein [Alkalihalobacillus sp. LMS39]UOE95855.1 ligand-binding protein SH3 [Alkalihalobacillus sp. LMS39]
MIQDKQCNMFKVMKQHKSSYPNPIQLSKNQAVIAGEKYSGNESWERWVYCFTLDKKLEGWVPEQIIKKVGKEALIIEDYIAKELNVEVGERIIKRKELNGWLWVKNVETEEEGWVPQENVKPIAVEE